MKKIAIKIGKKGVWYPIKTFVVITIVIASLWTVITIAKATPQQTEATVEQTYISPNETLWDIYEETNPNMSWGKFCFKVEKMNGKTTFNVGERLLIPIK